MSKRKTVEHAVLAPRHRVGNVRAAFQIGFCRTMLVLGSHYREIAANEGARDVNVIPHASHARLSEAFQRIGPSISSDKSLYIQKMLTRAGQDIGKCRRTDEYQSLADQINSSFDGAFDGCWALQHWITLGAQFADLYSGMSAYQNSEQSLTSLASEFAKALCRLPPETFEQSSFLMQLKASAESTLFIHDFDQFGMLVIEEFHIRFLRSQLSRQLAAGAESADMKRPKLASKDGITAERKSLLSKEMQKGWVKSRYLYEAIGTLNMMLPQILSEITDAPVFLFKPDTDGARTVNYKGRTYPVTANFRQWTIVLNDRKGVSLTQSKARLMTPNHGEPISNNSFKHDLDDAPPIFRSVIKARPGNCGEASGYAILPLEQRDFDNP